jgi:hypothetical protein
MHRVIRAGDIVTDLGSMLVACDCSIGFCKWAYYVTGGMYER